MSGPGVTDGLATDTIFLGSERERHKSGGLQFPDRSQQRVDAALANPTLHILNAEEIVVRLRGTCILARAQQEVKPHDEAVGDRQVKGCARRGREMCHGGDDIQGKWFDTRWRVIPTLPSSQDEGSETEVELPKGV